MAIKLYPVTKTELKTCDYEVKVNGQKVDLDTARVSAMPFNRRWPGHQRGIEQTELINFLSLMSDESLTFEIKPKKTFENFCIRPASLGIMPKKRQDGTIMFTIDKPAYFTVEPYGRNNALHIFVDPVKEYDNLKSDESVLYFGAGEHDVGEINIKSNQTLFIDEGAVVYACVKAIDADNVKIVGRGILDNSRNKERILFEANEENNDVAVNNAQREHTIRLEYCTNVEVEGITIRDSLVYNIRPLGCKNLHIHNVKIIGCWRYNSDGIDMHNCEDVLIENCFLRTFDDSVCVKGFDCYYAEDVEKAVHDAMYRNGKVYDVFKNAVIKNCVIWNDWGKSLEIGAETRAEEIANILFTDCDIIHVTGAVLDSYNVDYADVHDIIFRNINIEYDNIIPNPVIQKKDNEVYAISNPDFAPAVISATTAYNAEYSAGGTRRGKTRDITFDNIHLFGRQKPRLWFAGYDEEHKTKDITVNNLYWNNKLVTEENCENFGIGNYTENIHITTSEKQS